MDERNNQTPESLSTKRLIEKNAMRHTFSRVGWSVLVLMLATGFAANLVESLFSLFSKSPDKFISKYYLYYNEVVVALSVLAGFLVLMSMPTAAPQKKKATVKEILTYICVCFAIGWVGNIIGTQMLNVWNTFTGNEVVNHLSAVLSTVEPWQVFICTGILAPILEELFFRKLMIDRTRRYGELASILVSAFFFALFHGNFSQFFYAFGIGVLFGYVYCRTGSYVTVTLLHMAFNIVMGVIPAALSPGILAFAEELMLFESDAEIIALAVKHAAAIVPYFLLIFVQDALSIVGIVLLIINRRRIYIEKSTLSISAEEQRNAAVLNAGVIVAVAALVLITVSTLFT